MAEARQRDIDLVLITGAGASRRFGAERPFPLMGEWVEAISVKMTTTGPGQRQMLGLEGISDGPQFEKRLGEFLREVQAFRASKPLLNPSLQLFNMAHEAGSRMPSGSTWLETWYQETDQALREIEAKLAETLNELFAGAGPNGNYVDDVAAAAGYGALLSALRIDAGASWVCATTNYDLVAEMALEQLGLRPDWGRKPQLLNPSSDAVLDVQDLIGGMPRYVPVLHLHGRVRWHLQPDGSVRDLAVQGHVDQPGSPVVMWPDDQKDERSYASTAVINSLWRQFLVTLSRARAVVVLGHALNDHLLVGALRERVDPQRLAVCVYPPDATEFASRVTETFGQGATAIPVDFTSSPTGLDELQEWDDLRRRWSDELA